MSEAAGGVAAALEAVNCVAADVTGTTFGRLFAPGGALVTVLTILLTLYVAVPSRTQIPARWRKRCSFRFWRECQQNTN